MRRSACTGVNVQSPCGHLATVPDLPESRRIPPMVKPGVVYHWPTSGPGRWRATPPRRSLSIGGSIEARPWVVPGGSRLRTMLASPSMADYARLLSALAGWVPWLLLFVAILVFRKQVAGLLGNLRRQVEEGGATVEIAGVFKFSPRSITKTNDLAPEIARNEVTILGVPDQMVLLFKAQGTVGDRTFAKSTKAMELPGGCLVQVSSEVAMRGGSATAAEALQYVPGVRIVREQDGKGARLAPVS